jgi:extradiol dioxygenase family protein
MSLDQLNQARCEHLFHPMLRFLGATTEEGVMAFADSSPEPLSSQE